MSTVAKNGAAEGNACLMVASIFTPNNTRRAFFISPKESFNPSPGSKNPELGFAREPVAFFIVHTDLLKADRGKKGSQKRQKICSSESFDPVPAQAWARGWIKRYPRGKK